MSKSDTLLVKAFTMRHRTTGELIHLGGQIDTDEGTAALWAHLEREGYVVKATRSGRGIMGHYFSRKTTLEGDARIKELISSQAAPV